MPGLCVSHARVAECTVGASLLRRSEGLRAGAVSGLPGGGRWEVIGAVSGARESLRGPGECAGLGESPVSGAFG